MTKESQEKLVSVKMDYDLINWFDNLIERGWATSRSSIIISCCNACKTHPEYLTPPIYKKIWNGDNDNNAQK